MLSRTRNFVSLGLVAMTLLGTTIATTSQADAHNNFGRGLAAGIAGTVIGGALIAGAEHHSAYGTPFYAEPAYIPSYPVVQAYPQCHVVWKQNAWGDMYRARVCD